MIIRDFYDCPEFISGDESILREFFNPLKDPMELSYSLAHAMVKPGRTTLPHRLKTSEVYYILKGRGTIFIDGKPAEVREHQAVYIPPHCTQYIRNTGEEDLKFLCIVDPAWKPEDEEIVGR